MNKPIPVDREYFESELRNSYDAGYEVGYERGFAQAKTWIDENKRLKELLAEKGHF
jgi:hypothetical protein